MIQIRHAVYDDLIPLAIIQTLSWKSAFSDILSNSTLNKYTDLGKCLKILENAYNSGNGYLYIGSNFSRHRRRSLSAQLTAGAAVYYAGSSALSGSRQTKKHVARTYFFVWLLESGSKG